MTSLSGLTSIKVTVTGARGAVGLSLQGPLVPGQFLVWNGDRKVQSASGTGADAGLRADLLATNGGQLLRFQQAGTGSVARTVQAKAREMVSVLDFGAKGDGTTDDRAAIQAAIDYVGAAGGGTVYLPATSGRYRITAGLKLPSYTTLCGVAPSRYPFNAGNLNSAAILADFATANQWVVEPKTMVAGSPVAYNVSISGNLPSGVTYNCAVRDLTITSTGIMPYGGIRMHGCPGSVVSNVAINNVSCGLWVNYSFGGNYSVHCLTAYYGVVAWDDVNGATFEVYAAQQSGAAATVPAGYLLPFMASLNGALVPTHKLATNAHYNRPFGVILGSLSSTSNTNVLDAVVERFGGGIFTLYAYSTDFRKCYLEGAANEMAIGIVGAQSSFNIQALHGYLSGTGALLDIGLGVSADVHATGSLFTSSMGTVWASTNTSLFVRGVTREQYGPTAPQFNIIYERVGTWLAPTLSNSWVAVVGDIAPGFRLEGQRLYFQGTINGGAASAPAFTLPAGYRPYQFTRFQNFTISAAGVVTPTTTGPIALNGISFEATQ